MNSLAQLRSQPGGIRVIALNDPPRRNAMGLEMAEAFQAAIESLRSDTDARVLILTGEGSAFSAGGDLQMLQRKAELSVEQNRNDMLAFYDAFLCMLSLRVPIIAAINGHAIGAGAGVAMACDYRIIADAAKFGFTFTQLGLHPGMGVTHTIPRIAGQAVATDLLVSGRVINATEAHTLRLVNAVVETGQVLPTAHDYAESLLAAGPAAVAGLLQTLRPRPKLLQEALAREAEQQALNYQSSEFRDRVSELLRG